MFIEAAIAALAVMRTNQIIRQPCSTSTVGDPLPDGDSIGDLRDESIERRHRDTASQTDCSLSLAESYIAEMITDSPSSDTSASYDGSGGSFDGGGASGDWQ